VSIRIRASHILTDSQFSKNDIQNELGIPEDMITVIPNGVDDFFFKKSEKDCKSVLAKLGINFNFIFHLGGTTPNKNTIGAIQAYDFLVHKKEYEDVYLVIVGISPTRENKIIQYVKALKLGGKVKFLNNISDEELKCLYSNSELFLFPSLYEGFGLPPLEAMACGTPVVVSNSTSLPEVVGEAAVKVDPNEPYEIGEAMANVLCDEQLRMKLIKAGRQRVENYRCENSVKLLLRVFEDLLKE
jgi:glycosyltransferase involved in cell wall biosynthesis